MIDPRRLGRIKLSGKFLRENPLGATKVLERTLVLKCECDFETDVIEYLVWCYDYATLQEGQSPPLILTKSYTDTWTFTNWTETLFLGKKSTGCKSSIWYLNVIPKDLINFLHPTFSLFG